MSTSIWTRLVIAGLAVCAVAAVVAPASGQTPRPDGSTVAPSVADVGKGADPSGRDPVVHRHGLNEMPYVTDLGAGTASASAGGFHWNDAAIGAGLGAVAALIAIAGAYGLRARRAVEPRRL